MSLGRISARRRETTYPSEFTELRNDKRMFSPAEPKPLHADAILLARLRSGEEYAYEDMVRRFGGRLLGTALRYLRSEDDAHDALQDTFLYAFRSIGNFKGDSQLSTWLHRIVINTSLMHLRARKRRPETEEAQINELLPRFDPRGHWIGEWTAAVPAHISVEISESRAMVRRCIGRLPDNHRIILLLRDIDELSTGEVASLLGVTANIVKVRLHRARLALGVLIEREQAL
jgi:RNA polymerase sigma-70 factor, ECF subfamily